MSEFVDDIAAMREADRLSLAMDEANARDPAWSKEGRARAAKRARATRKRLKEYDAR